jgi:hypothetical protein
MPTYGERRKKLIANSGAAARLKTLLRATRPTRKIKSRGAPIAPRHIVARWAAIPLPPRLVAEVSR